MFSYWEQQSYLNYNHIVIGGGITGLSTAIELKATYPQDFVLVLERGILPSGASTKNAGFACMGSVTELLEDLETMSEAEVVALFLQRKRGLEILRKRLGDSNMGYAENGSFELIDSHAKNALKNLDTLNEMLLAVNKRPSFKIADDKIKLFGFDDTQVISLIENTCEGEIHTGKMMQSLIAYARSMGVEIYTGADVKSYTEEGSRVVAEVTSIGSKQPRLFTTKTLSICTNAFAKELLPDEDIAPGRGQVLITKPIEGLLFKGVFHMDKGYYYFRAIDNRVLIGGGRNLDFEQEETFSQEVTSEIQAALEQKLREVILPNTAFEVDYRWAGTMAFGKNKQPVIKAISNRVFGAFRMGGMGIAIGSEAARQLAELVAQAD